MVLAPLSAQESAALIEELYTVAGPRIGCLLVEANLVFTIAGIRGQTETGIWFPRPEDKAAFEYMGVMALPLGIRIEDFGQDLTDPKGNPLLMVNFESLRGFARSSKRSDVPGVPPFDAASGWDGLMLWRRALVKECKALIEDGTIPFQQERQDTICTGVVKGYPRLAIYDFCQWLNEGKGYFDPRTMCDCTPPAAHVYGGPLPGFACAKAHEDDPSITGVIAEWQQFLEDFYQTPWHLKIKEDAEFQTAREERKQRRI